MPGYWLRLSSGSLSGYWVRESSSAGLAGKVGAERFDAPRRAILRAGTHIGRHFAAGGGVSAAKSYRPSTGVKVTATERAVINGAWRLRISRGPLSGYWVTESSVAYLPGAVQLTDLNSGKAVVDRGTRTGHRYNSAGGVLSAKTAWQPSAQKTLTASWAVVNGRPVFYVVGGRWMAHWLGESSSVHLP